MASPSHLDRKDFVQTLPRERFKPRFPAPVEYSAEALYNMAREEHEVRLDASMVGCTIMFLYGHSAARQTSTGTICEVKHDVIRGGLRQTIMSFMRSDEIQCEIALSMSNYWSLDSDHMLLVWFVLHE